MAQLYVDLDGVIADFDAGYERAFKVRPKDLPGDVDWDAIEAYRTFYLDLPTMPDYPSLWARISRYQPIILTGVPREIGGAEAQKREWVNRYFGPKQMVICCRSADKAAYCRPGDLLIDDRENYRQPWLDAGGVWITHTSAINTARQLTELGW